MKNRCPEHGRKLVTTKGWKPPEGYDPKMTRLTCLACVEAWYKAPRKCLRRWDEVQAEMTLQAV